jgi:hypothetical protein
MLHPIPYAPEIYYEIRGINDTHYKKYGFVFNFDFYSHMFLIKTCSEQKSRFELIAAHLKLAESVETVGNTDRRQT